MYLRYIGAPYIIPKAVDSSYLIAPPTALHDSLKNLPTLPLSTGTNLPPLSLSLFSISISHLPRNPSSSPSRIQILHPNYLNPPSLPLSTRNDSADKPNHGSHKLFCPLHDWVPDLSHMFLEEDLASTDHPEFPGPLIRDVIG